MTTVKSGNARPTLDWKSRNLQNRLVMSWILKFSIGHFENNRKYSDFSGQSYSSLWVCVCVCVCSSSCQSVSCFLYGRVLYGIVVSMQDRTKVSTLKMIMDFSKSQCIYWRVRQVLWIVSTKFWANWLTKKLFANLHMHIYNAHTCIYLLSGIE